MPMAGRRKQDPRHQNQSRRSRDCRWQAATVNQLIQESIKDADGRPKETGPKASEPVQKIPRLSMAGRYSESIDPRIHQRCRWQAEGNRTQGIRTSPEDPATVDGRPLQ